jgi:peroxiredoxin
MTQQYSLLTLFSAILCIFVGVWLLVQTGLPNRADYSGNFIGDVGYVAPELNHVAPPFTLTTVNFEKLKTDDLNNPVIIINFWATWCVPCRAEMPELQSLYNTYENQIRILGVNLGETPKSVAQWIDEYDLTFDILLDPLQSVAQLYQIRGQPSTYVLDSNRVIRAIYYGQVRMEQLEQDVTRLLNPEG